MVHFSTEAFSNWLWLYVEAEALSVGSRVVMPGHGTFQYWSFFPFAVTLRGSWSSFCRVSSEGVNILQPTLLPFGGGGFFYLFFSPKKPSRTVLGCACTEKVIAAKSFAFHRSTWRFVWSCLTMSLFPSKLLHDYVGKTLKNAVYSATGLFQHQSFGPIQERNRSLRRSKRHDLNSAFYGA